MSRKPGDLITKDPGSTEPQGFDWTDYCAEIGANVTVSTSSWAVSGPDSSLTVGNSSIVSGSLKTKTYLSGGTVGAIYTVTNTIVTDSNPVVTDDRSFQVLIEQK